MEATKREMTNGGPISDAPGHYLVKVTVEGREGEWNFLRQPDGTYWEIARIGYVPLRVELGAQIVDAKALALCDRHYQALKDTEGARIKILGLRKLAGTEPQRYELQLYDEQEQTRGYCMSTKYGTEEQIRAIFRDGGLTEGQIEFYFARAS